MIADLIVERAPANLDGTLPATATFSPGAQTYRYVLTRDWASGDRIGWLMLNPSKASAMVDDQTIRRCTSYSRAWGAGGLVVVNLFALRSTDPAALAAHADPVGAVNDEVTVAELTDPTVRFVVAAWGAHPFAARRVRDVAALLAAHKVSLRCLGTTQGGHPRHPSRLADGIPLLDYAVGGDSDA
jgi:hypothetical protein